MKRSTGSCKPSFLGSNQYKIKIKLLSEHLLLFLLLAWPAASIDDKDVLLLSSLLDLPPADGTDGVADDGGVDGVLSNKWLKILDVVNDIWLEAVWKHVLSLEVASVTSSWVGWGTPLLPAEAGIDTTGTTPGGLHTNVEVALDTVELLGPLLDDFLVWCWSNRRHVLKGQVEPPLTVPIEKT